MMDRVVWLMQQAVALQRQIYETVAERLNIFADTGDWQQLEPNTPRAADGDDIATIDLPFHMRRKGVEAKLMLSGETHSKPSQDTNLIQLIREVHRWLDSLTSGKVSSIDDLASHEGIPASEISRTLQLAFLAPGITKSILLGTQPADLTAQSLKRLGQLPASWQEQRRLLGMHDQGCPTG